MLKFKTKIGARGQIVIPKIVRENLGITEQKIIFLELEEKTLKLSVSDGQEILNSWREIAKKEGCNVSKEIVYGDKLYEEIFSK